MVHGLCISANRSDSAVALRLAVEHRPAALIPRSPFTSLTDIGRHHYPLLPVGLLLRDRFASIDLAHRIQSPVPVIAGDRDSVVPIKYTRRLYAAVVAPKTGASNFPASITTTTALLAGDEMIQSILQFVRPL